MKRVLVTGIAGIAALTAGSMAGIYVLTEPDAAGAVRTVAAAPSRPSEVASAPVGAAPPWFQTGLAAAPAPAPAAEQLEAPVAVPPPAPRSASRAAPLPNASRPIAGPVPSELPTDAAEREKRILALRRDRFASQMDALNRRSAARGGRPAEQTPQPRRLGRSGRGDALAAE